jgi:hypothetical protein
MADERRWVSEGGDNGVGLGEGFCRIAVGDGENVQPRALGRGDSNQLGKKGSRRDNDRLCIVETVDCGVREIHHHLEGTFCASLLLEMFLAGSQVFCQNRIIDSFQIIHETKMQYGAFWIF